MFGNVVQSFGIDVNTLPVVLNLVAWFDAADDNTITEAGGTVSQWDDKSGNGHNATQGSGSLQPEFVADVVNGLPILRFDGIDDVLELSSVVVSGTAARTIFMVCRAETTNTGMVALNETVGAGAGSIYDMTPEIAIRVASGNRVFNETVVNASVYFVLMFQSAASSNVSISIIRLDGVPGTELSVTSQAINTDNTTNTVIGKNTTTDFCEVDFGEIIMYDRALSASEIESVERYLGVKWGISVT